MLMMNMNITMGAAGALAGQHKSSMPRLRENRMVQGESAFD